MSEELNLESIKSNINSDDYMFEICAKYVGETFGNIIEIGAGDGSSTRNFLKISKTFNKKVIVIDPFENGWKDMPASYGSPYPYEKFKEKISDLKENCIEIRKSSQDKTVIDDVHEFLPVSFSFIDGLQYKNAVLNDLNLVDSLDSKVICLDDYSRLTEISQVPLAVEEFLNLNGNKYHFFSDGRKERSKAFLIRK